MTIQIMNLRNSKPSQPWDVRVDRSNPLGNPFYMNNESERDKVCDKYEEWFVSVCDFQGIGFPANLTTQVEFERLCVLYTQYKKLNLFCWCAPLRCHAETIRKYILKATGEL